MTHRPPPGAFFPAPTVPHLIKPDPDEVVDARIPPRYHLRSQRSSHHIAAALPTNTTYPHSLPSISFYYVTATRLLLAVEAARTASAANFVTDEVTGKSLEYQNLLRGPNIYVCQQRSHSMEMRYLATTR